MGAVHSGAFSPDGEWLAGGFDGHSVTLWNTSSGREALMLRGHSRRVRGVAFSPDGETLASGSDDATIMLWDLSTKEAETRSVSSP